MGGIRTIWQQHDKVLVGGGLERGGVVRGGTPMILKIGGVSAIGFLPTIAKPATKRRRDNIIWIEIRDCSSGYIPEKEQDSTRCVR
ncbi:hypothetical protein BG74_08925 [Sodalis-like endosymbiont of Proechinophthirus fluctus]|uniref:hypothetical protein n=1 Tax=Sodalis-like endosymbiont of Proechinophthirus fluctus TaxID=1462730 RepID=UPI0007A91D20|nr:hypothetical protein [Sodalis-like endosymbiont of Proechinophthirus fluctus]KYP95417.1 hypothetical protein BG74_08925 [Sodalis-like endosymbiont of Proechinophthirus fluctus]